MFSAKVTLKFQDSMTGVTGGLQSNEVEKNKLHFNTIESQLCDLGVQVIWYEDHKEVPEILRKIIAPLR